MENLNLSFQVIAPIMILLGVGLFLNRLGFLNEEVNRLMNRVVALVLLPVLVFVNIYNSEAQSLLSPNILLFCVIGIAFEFFAAFILVRLVEKDKLKCGVMLQGMFRSNYVIFGIPIAVSLYGSEGSSAAALLTMIVIPMYNTLAVVALELFKTGKFSVLLLLKKVVTNPLIIASVVGLIFSVTGIRIPGFIFKPISDMASAATPMAFIFLGASFAFSSVKSHIKQLSLTVLIRLVVFPLILLTAAIAMGIHGLWLVVLLSLFASPTAVSSFSLSQAMGADHKLAGNVVVFSSAVSIVTMFLWIFILKSMNFL